MPETLSLYELNLQIRSVLDNSFPGTYMVTAEIASCNVKNHCYMSLVDKAEDTIRAEMNAVIWANKYRSISSRFRDETGSDLKKGIKILFEASVSFHERYGLKLNITDIDPSYTIGEMAVRRKEILERLSKEGLTERNREVEFPVVPQRIGIISSSTAAGYEDLMSHLVNNAYGYRFDCRLYEAAMQGDRAEESIVAALKNCINDASDLDLAVIVRGGGGQTDLSCFDSYEIGKTIAALPLPMISGIGHHRDRTVVDEVSNSIAKTPTAVADMIITRVKEFEDRIDMAAHNLVHGTGKMTVDLREDLSEMSRRFELAVRNSIIESSHRLDIFIRGLQYAIRFIKNEGLRIRALNNTVNLLNPRNILKRGYSITYHNNRTLKSVSDVKTGDSIRTVLSDGEILSNVQNNTTDKK